MRTAEIREKLQTYIQFADEKKVKAFYTIVEKEIEEEYKWTEDKEFIKELNKRSEEFRSGAAKGSEWEIVKKRIQTSSGAKLKR